MIHWHAVLKILGYVRETSSLKITFQRESSHGLMLRAYADANYASRTADMRSVSGGPIMCGGGCVSWFSRTQKCVTLFPTEAEYVTMADGVNWNFYVGGILVFMMPIRRSVSIGVYDAH